MSNGQNQSKTTAEGRRARRLAPDIRRSHLLASAIRVFGRKGIGAARHRDVAAEAAVSLSTVFAYFPTRARLVAAVLDEVAAWAIRLATRMHRPDLPAPHALYQHLAQFADLLDAQPEYALVWLHWSIPGDGELWRRYLRLERRIVHIISDTVRRGQEDGEIVTLASPEDVALLVIGAGYVIAKKKLSGTRRTQIERFTRGLIAPLFARGLRVATTGDGAASAVRRARA